MRFNLRQQTRNDDLIDLASFSGGCTLAAGDDAAFERGSAAAPSAAPRPQPLALAAPAPSDAGGDGGSGRFRLLARLGGVRQRGLATTGIDLGG